MMHGRSLLFSSLLARSRNALWNLKDGFSVQDFKRSRRRPLCCCSCPFSSLFASLFRHTAHTHCQSSPYNNWRLLGNLLSLASVWRKEQSTYPSITYKILSRSLEWKEQSEILFSPRRWQWQFGTPLALAASRASWITSNSIRCLDVVAPARPMVLIHRLRLRQWVPVLDLASSTWEVAQAGLDSHLQP